MKRSLSPVRRVRTTGTVTRTGGASTRRWLPCLLGLTLLLSGPAHAQAKYKIQEIIKLRDPLPGTPFKATQKLLVDALNDRGQILFGTATATNLSPAFSEALFLYDNGTFVPIVVPEGESPIGKWPRNIDITSPLSMNQSGNAVFAVVDLIRAFSGGLPGLGTFLWDYQAQKVTAVALNNSPAVDGLTFRQAGGGRPGINRNNEIVFAAEVRDASAKVLGSGVFFRGRDGKLQTVALPGRELPGGGKVQNAFDPTLNDAGRIAFLASRQGQNGAPGAYLWEKGALTPLAQIDADAPNGGKIVGVDVAYVNNKNGTVLLDIYVGSGDSATPGLYRFSEGKLTPLAVPGQPMPEGGKLRFPMGLSFANEAGQHAFYALLEGGFTAAYLLDADGTPSLILKSGTTTDLGRIAWVGAEVGGGTTFGVGLNSQGQVAMPIKIDVLPTMIALLTPVAR